MEEKYNLEKISYACTVIEYIVRMKFLQRAEVVKELGKNNIKSLCEDFYVWHFSSYESTAEDFANDSNIRCGMYDFIERSKRKPLNPRILGKMWANLAIYIANKKNIDIIDAIYDVFSNSNIEQELENSTDLSMFEDPRYVQRIYKEGNFDYLSRLLINYR